VCSAMNRGCTLFVWDRCQVSAGLLDEPVELFGESWFVEQVLLNPALTAAVRALLGAHLAGVAIAVYCAPPCVFSVCFDRGSLRKYTGRCAKDAITHGPRRAAAKAPTSACRC
jgi:hypothetical protein